MMPDRLAEQALVNECCTSTAEVHPYSIKHFPDGTPGLMDCCNHGLLVAGGKVLEVAHHAQSCKAIKACMVKRRAG